MALVNVAYVLIKKMLSASMKPTSRRNAQGRSLRGETREHVLRNIDRPAPARCSELPRLGKSTSSPRSPLQLHTYHNLPTSTTNTRILTHSLSKTPDRRHGGRFSESSRLPHARFGHKPHGAAASARASHNNRLYYATYTSAAGRTGGWGYSWPAEWP